MNCVPLVLFSGANFLLTWSRPEYLNFLYLTLALSAVIGCRRPEEICKKHRCELTLCRNTNVSVFFITKKSSV